MDAFMSTYMKDYVWPKQPPRDTGGGPGTVDPASQPCPQCGCKGMTGFPGVTGSLCAPPVADTSLYDQPCHYLRKLQEKYPFLFQVLERLPPEDLIARVYRDRLRTTYQADYCRDGDLPPEQYAAVVAAAPAAGGVAPPATQGASLPGDECRPRMKAPSCLAARAATVSKQPHTKEKKEGGELPARVVTGRTEYQDGVSATGARIMNEKLLYPEEKRGKKH
ncbi:uncharacterized protein LOC126195554 [Schistocerca nitens]|uniref:uncharacterized protein LOC126195554 n=1 Tax=Schistocerca nitens TaxID=7011 RepID=UPI0021196D1E|nr:uncharacterized protein LOC126195554 [Schistocerca nitens]